MRKNFIKIGFSENGTEILGLFWSYTQTLGTKCLEAPMPLWMHQTGPRTEPSFQGGPTCTSVGTHAHMQSSCHWKELRRDPFLSRSTNPPTQACSWWAGLSEFPREGMSPAKPRLALGEPCGGTDGAAFPSPDLASWPFSRKQRQHPDGVWVNSTASSQGHWQNVLWKHENMWLL